MEIGKYRNRNNLLCQWILCALVAGTELENCLVLVDLVGLQLKFNTFSKPSRERLSRERYQDRS